MSEKNGSLQGNWVDNWNENEAEMAAEAKPRPHVMEDFLDSSQIRAMGVSCGEGCLVHNTAKLYGRKNITFGDNVRIDAWTMLSAGNGSIHIGSFTHVSLFCSIFGSAGVFIDDYSAVGAYSSILSVSDDFRKALLIGPMLPLEKRALKSGPVRLEKYTCLAQRCTLLPGSTLSEGSFMHLNSVLIGKSEPYAILEGSPAKKIRDRPKEFLQLL